MGEVLQQMSGYINFNDHLHSISPPPPHPPLSAGGQPSIQNFKKGGGSGKKMSAWWVLKSLCHRYLPRGIYIFCQKKPL